MPFDEHSLFVDHGFTQEEIDAMRAEQESYCPDRDDDRGDDFEYDQDVDFDMYSEW